MKKNFCYWLSAWQGLWYLFVSEAFGQSFAGI